MTARALAAVVVLAAGGPFTFAALGPRYGGELVVALPRVPADIAPAPPRSPAERLVFGLVHETLVTLGDDGELRPALAEAWSWDPDARHWTLRLRAGTRFHDGEPVTAADVVRSLTAFLRGPSAAAAALTRDVEGGAGHGGAPARPGLAAPDAHTVLLRSAGAVPPRLEALTAAAAAIVSPRGAAAGPFAPVTPSLRSGAALLAFEGHFRGRPFLDRVRLVDHAAAADDAARRIDLAAGPTLPGAPSATLLLVLDPRRPPFDDPRTRVRVAQAVDRVALARHFLEDALPAWTLLPPPLMPPVPAPASPRPATATRSGPVLLRVATAVPASASQRVLAHLDALGLGARVVAVPPAEVWEGSADGRLLAWAPEVADPLLALEELAALTEAQGGGAAAAVVEEARRELRAAGLAREADSRLRHLLRAEERLREPAVLLPLATLPLRAFVGQGVHGVRGDAASRLLLEDAWTEP